jgi:hypothetical protein
MLQPPLKAVIHKPRIGAVSASPPATPSNQGTKPGTILAAALCCLAVAGCVTMPPVSHDSGVARDEMAAHIAFLSQPALKGRKPGSSGSRLARDYIEARFKAYGLVPWAKTTGYELSFGFGRNVVGVLPGADTNLAREVVLLSAHYDHLGKEHGKLHPGAADNASGVAALLETARQLSRLEPRPKRSVAFIAFDCEEKMLLGSFAFTCREDVREARIAAVVNVDMLGRDFMDVVRDTVFVTGTEEYPGLREQVGRFGTTAGMRVLPIGTDLVGPRGDHASFESLGVPCLFFSCGMFRDYHQPTDTADKLNYDAIDRSAKVILQTVRELADTEFPRRAAGTDTGDLEELRTMTTVLAEVMKSGEKAEIKQDDLETFKRLETQAGDLLQSGHYDRRTREELVLAATGTLVPYLWPGEDAGKPPSAEQQQEMKVGLQFLQLLYIHHRGEIVHSFRSLVAQLLKYHPGLFRGMPKFEREVYDIADKDILLAETGPGTCELNALATQLTIQAEVRRSKWLVNSFGGSLSASLAALHCEGTREQVVDYCLLLQQGLRTNSARAKSLRKLLHAVSGTATNGSYDDLLADRLKRGRFKDQTDWMTNCILTGTPWLAQQALQSAGDRPNSRLRSAACLVLADRYRRPDVRAEAIELVTKQRDKQGLLAVCDVLDDASLVYTAEYDPLLREDCPFADRMLVKIARPLAEKQLERPPTRP